MVLGVSFAIGQFWFAWTGYKASIHWIAPTLSGLASGFGLMSIFLQCLVRNLLGDAKLICPKVYLPMLTVIMQNYLIDAYLMFAASAIAANTFLRSLCGAVFPLFATYMIEGMGVQWAGTLLGCVAIALVPLPVWFYLRGDRLREKSNFAPTFSMANQDHAPDESEDEEKGKLEADSVGGGLFGGQHSDGAPREKAE